MKINDFKTFVVGNPPPHFGGRYWIFLKLTTDSGIVGYGEAYSIPFHPNVVEHMIGDVCERYVIGSDPFKIEKLWRIVYGSGFTLRPDISIMGILSAIEMACWEDGYLIPPNKPGLGVELNEEVAAGNPYAGKELHLEMLDIPVN